MDVAKAHAFLLPDQLVFERSMHDLNGEGTLGVVVVKVKLMTE